MSLILLIMMSCSGHSHGETSADQDLNKAREIAMSRAPPTPMEQPIDIITELSESFKAGSVPFLLFSLACSNDADHNRRVMKEINKWVEDAELYWRNFQRDVPSLTCQKETQLEDFEAVLAFVAAHPIDSKIKN